MASQTRKPKKIGPWFEFVSNLQRTESFALPGKKMMMMVHHDNHRRPFSSSERGEADGPTCNRPPVTDNYPNNNSVYDVVVAAAAGSSSSGGQVLRGLQPFDISNRTTNTCISAHHTAFRSPGL